MIRWLFRNVLGALWDELIAQLRAQLRAFVEPFAVLDDEMREAVGGVTW